MIRKIFHHIKFLGKIKVCSFFYLNYMCKSVTRTDTSKIIPYKNVVIEIDRNSEIIVGGGDIELGCDLIGRSNTETRLRLRSGAVWSSYGGCRISYGSTIEILQHAVLDSRYFSMNSDSVMIAAKKIVIGQDVMMGRNVVVYDSDHHQIRNRNGETVNPSEAVVIGDHVWLATNVTVLKGVTVGPGSMVASGTVVRKNIGNDRMVYTKCQINERENFGGWRRKSP